MMILQSIEDVRGAVGTTVGYSDWRKLSQKDVDDFAEVTGDRQWIHVDRERAAVGPFGATIVHGYFTLSLIPLFLDEVFSIEGTAMSVNYGLDKVRFLSPVLSGSRLRGKVSFTRLDETHRGHQLHMNVTIEVDGLEKPACIAETIALLVME